MDLSTIQKDDAHSQNDEIKSDGEPNENSDNSQQKSHACWCIPPR